jgi:hypothetical protein
VTSYTKQSTRHQLSMQRQAHAWAHIHMIHRLIKQLDGKDLPRTRAHAVKALEEYATEVWRVCAAEPPSEALKQRAAADASYLAAQMHRMDPPATGDEWEHLVVAGRKLAGVGGLK